jgi:hypothetical protein
LHDTLLLPARESYSCGPASREFDDDLGPAEPLPKLFSAYLRLGGKIISEPALDRAFGTVDFLVLVDASRTKFGTITRDNIMRKLRAPAKLASSVASALRRR